MYVYKYIYSSIRPVISDGIFYTYMYKFALCFYAAFANAAATADTSLRRWRQANTVSSCHPCVSSNRKANVFLGNVVCMSSLAISKIVKLIIYIHLNSISISKYTYTYTYTTTHTVSNNLKTRKPYYVLSVWNLSITAWSKRMF